MISQSEFNLFLHFRKKNGIGIKALVTAGGDNIHRNQLFLFIKMPDGLNRNLADIWFFQVISVKFFSSPNHNTL